MPRVALPSKQAANMVTGLKVMFLCGHQHVDGLTLPVAYPRGLDPQVRPLECCVEGLRHISYNFIQRLTI